jgi:hypothetical protein
MDLILAANGLTGIASAVACFMLAAKFRKEQQCVLQKPVFIISCTMFITGLLFLAGAFGALSFSSVDSGFVFPVLNLVILAAWFYFGIFVSGHSHIFYLLPVLIMSANVLLIINRLALFSEVLTGLVIVGVFFHVGLVDHRLKKHISYTGMAYGIALLAASIAAYLLKSDYLSAFWFVPNIASLALVAVMLKTSHPCYLYLKPEPHHLPVVVEVFRFGFFVISLSAFLMLGILGVHELGHSLAAASLGCEHSTMFGIGKAVTRVSCPGDSGSTLLTLAGLIMTLIVSALMYLFGNDFSRRISCLLAAFSFVISLDDLTVLGLPQSGFIALVFASALLACYGILLIVQNYEVEYVAGENSCASPGCNRGVDAK